MHAYGRLVLERQIAPNASASQKAVVRNRHRHDELRLVWSFRTSQTRRTNASGIQDTDARGLDPETEGGPGRPRTTEAGILGASRLLKQTGVAGANKSRPGKRRRPMRA